MKLRLATPTAVVDIGRVPELRGIARSGDAIRIGALTTHSEVATSADVQKGAAALAEAAGVIGDPAVRARGTIGGNIAHADPASDLPTVLVALDAQIVIAGPTGEHTLAADGFFTGIMTTALADHEVVTAVLVPVAGRAQGSAYVKFSHPASRYAVIGVAASLTMTGHQCSAARIAIGGLVPHARRATTVERALVGTEVDTAAVAAAAGQVGSDLGSEVTGDLFASASYRASVVPVYVRRAIAAAAARAGLA
jgi:carbon-monoxide dehydrogenase medium subunit